MNSSEETCAVASAPTRREFVSALFGVAAPFWAFAPPRNALGAPRAAGNAKHPEPRPGIDASKVLPSDKLKNPKAAPVFDMVRKMPQIIDGIRCECGCADDPGSYSLLSCFEGDAMAQECVVCQGEARLAFSMHQFRRPLARIREAIDRQFGHAKS